jgi:hypothetical protein
LGCKVKAKPLKRQTWIGKVELKRSPILYFRSMSVAEQIATVQRLAPVEQYRVVQAWRQQLEKDTAPLRLVLPQVESLDLGIQVWSPILEKGFEQASSAQRLAVLYQADVVGNPTDAYAASQSLLGRCLLKVLTRFHFSAS